MRTTLTLGGRPTFLLGVNYWSRGGGPRMWDRFDEARVRAELAQMRGIGLNTCRSFAFIPTFMPSPPQVAAEPVARLRRFLDLCSETGMSSIPSFLVGHMSGENYDFPGQAGRSPYTDPEVLAWQEALVRAVAQAGANHPAVAAYLASNEMPLWGGKASPETIVAWAQRLRSALRSVDPHRPFSLGDGVMNLKGGQNGFDVPSLRPIVDFYGPHTYAADSDPLRQAVNAEYCLRSVSYQGLPVIFEEFGCSSCQVSEENQALYYREVLHSCLSSGAAGALGWCFSDFDLADDPPYTHHAFELGFGITRADGSEKPVCGELRSFARLVEAIDYPSLRPPRPNVAILVPSYFHTTYPFSWEDRDRMRRTLLQSYLLCVAAGLEAELVPEEVDLAPYRLVLLPSTQKLLASTWRALLEHARRGHTVYWSYFGGDYNFHQGMWCQNFTELTGCRHTLRYGCADQPSDPAVLRGNGLELTARTTASGPFPRAFLPVEVLDGTRILCSDDRGRPALTRKAHGEGQVYLCTYPWEHYLAEQPDVNREDPAHTLYRFLAENAGVSSPYPSSHPSVQTRLVESAGGPLLWVTNHDWRPVRTRLDTPGAKALHGTDDVLPEGPGELSLQAKQVAVFRLARRGP
ncbi:MAG: beta-galactosidase trimerization domain-containing protein [Deltaproteobacteria bacterium]|nr:beta-galactosidase trimerization domain-containing protein [Deltaproteobacteria bacterium]